MTADPPWLAVVIPAHRAERTILTTLRSVLDQADTPGVEIIVVDDGLDAGCCQLVEELSDRVRVVRGPGRGAAGARNAGLRAANAPWVALLDADDRWLHGHLTAVREVLDRNPAAVACFGGARHVDEQGRLLRVFTPRQDHATVSGLLTRRLQPTTSATALRRDTVLEVGGFDEGFQRPAGVEDVDLWWRIATHGACVVQEQPLTEYVVHLSRDTTRPRSELLELRADRERCIRRLRATAPSRLARKAAAQHHAIMARYWLLAGYAAEARQDARRALRYWPTPDGVAALAMAVVPRGASAMARNLRRSISRLAERV